MLNVKALAWAFGLTAMSAFLIYVAYGLMVPPEYQGIFGGHQITFGVFLLELIQAIAGAVVAALFLGTVNNYFHRRWELRHSY